MAIHGSKSHAGKKLKTRVNRLLLDWVAILVIAVPLTMIWGLNFWIACFGAVAAIMIVVLVGAVLINRFSKS